MGLNSWQSAGAASAPGTAPGLRLVELELEDASALDALERTLAGTLGGAFESAREDDGELSLRDPDGQLLRFGYR